MQIYQKEMDVNNLNLRYTGGGAILSTSTSDQDRTFLGVKRTMVQLASTLKLQKIMLQIIT